ncbi:MAG: hypothetical protein IPO91_06585 [Chloroflexi bacterium]|nr:hypothetical protein [Chloroflexota bacterium]
MFLGRRSWRAGRGWRIGFGRYWGWLILFGIFWSVTVEHGTGIFFWLVVLGVILNRIHGASRWANANTDAEVEKRKRDDLSVDEDEDDEKPKNEPRYILGDDGELIPVDELEEKPKHSEYL